MKLAVISIGLILPAIAHAQLACPGFDPAVLECAGTDACGLDGRRALVQLLLSHDRLLSAVSPSPTAEERASYRTEIDSRDPDRFARAMASEVNGRMAVSAALAVRVPLLRALDQSLANVTSAGEPQPATDAEQLRRTAMWVRLGQEYADTTWILAWDRLRAMQPASGEVNASEARISDLAACGLITQSVLQIAHNDLVTRMEE